jgi:hypothetical protein
MDDRPNALLIMLGLGYLALCATLIAMAWSPSVPIGFTEASQADYAIGRRR